MSTNTKVIAGGVVVIVIIIGAIYWMSKNAPAAPATTAQPAQAANASSSPGQVQGQDVSVGTGAEATPGSEVSVLYVGKLQDGTVFDSSAAHNNEPMTFVLGTNSLIPGFQIGINGMKVGGERLLVIPATLAYGSQEIHQDPNDPKSPIVIPANSTLVFNVKLVAVKPGTSTPATAQ